MHYITVIILLINIIIISSIIFVIITQVQPFFNLARGTENRYPDQTVSLLEKIGVRQEQRLATTTTTTTTTTTLHARFDQQQ